MWLTGLSILCRWPIFRRWSGGAKVSCILRHWGIQLILAYSWARPAILIAGKGRGGMFLFLLSSFLFLLLPCPSLSSLLLSLLSLFSLSLGDDTKWPIRVDVSLNANTDRYSGRSIHYKCIPQVTDWYIGVQCSCRSSYTLSLADIRVYTSSDRPLYLGLLTDIQGNSVADTGLRILCRWQLFRYTIQLTGCYIPHFWLTQGYSVADRSSYTLSWPIFWYTLQVYWYTG